MGSGWGFPGVAMHYGEVNHPDVIVILRKMSPQNICS